MIDKIKQLKTELLTATDPWHKIDVLNDLAWELRDRDAKYGLALSKMAHEQATTAQFKEQPYQLGLAYSLRNLSYFNNQLGQFEVALSQGLAALALFEGIGQLKPTAEILYTIGDSCLALNDVNQALMYQKQALKITQAIDDLAGQMMIWRALADIYEQLADYKSAFHSLKQFYALEQQQPSTVQVTNPASLKTEILNIKQTQLNLTQFTPGETLPEGNSRYRSLFENAPIAILVTTINGHIIEANPTACTWLGFSLQNIQQYKIQHQFDKSTNWITLLRLLKQDGLVENFLINLAISERTPSQLFLTITRQPDDGGGIAHLQLFMTCVASELL